MLQSSLTALIETLQRFMHLSGSNTPGQTLSCDLTTVAMLGCQAKLQQAPTAGVVRVRDEQGSAGKCAWSEHAK